MILAFSDSPEKLFCSHGYGWKCRAGLLNIKGIVLHIGEYAYSVSSGESHENNNELSFTQWNRGEDQYLSHVRMVNMKLQLADG